jgi:hypothetical protein
MVVLQIPCTLCNDAILAFGPSALARELLFQSHDIKGHGAHFIRNGPNSPLPHSCLSRTPAHASCAFESNAIVAFARLNQARANYQGNASPNIILGQFVAFESNAIFAFARLNQARAATASACLCQTSARACEFSRKCITQYHSWPIRVYILLL